GQWSRALGKLAGVNIPLVSVQHQYLVTEKIDGVTPSLPTLRDPDRLTYWKEEVGGLVMGGYEPDPKPWAERGIPDGFEFQLLDNDLDHFEPILRAAIGRVPAMETAGIKTFINGPESFTPDGNFILGEAPEVRGVFVGAGFNAFGIASGGGAGMALAEWVARGSPPYDLWPVDIRRFGRCHLDTGWVRTRTLEAYAKHYTMAWPFEEHQSARPLRRSPLYDRLKARGAVFGEKLGFERPNWFSDAALGEAAEDVYSYDRQNWFAAVGREHEAARERVAIFDQTSFAKFLLIGRDAEKALSLMAANDVARPPGCLVYTQMLNAKGGIECDLTVGRLSETEYYIVTGTGFASHDFDWISRNIPAGLDARLLDVTTANAVLSVMGPSSRALLQRLADGDLANAALPFGRLQRICIAGADMLVLRITYVGELGYELHVPVDMAASVYDRLMQAGADLGVANAGYRAIESLRLEKAYRAWGSDIGPDHSPLMSGLGAFVKMKSKAPFIGREALEEQAGKPLPRLMAGFLADPSVILLGRETIFRNGVQVGWLSSGGFGYTVGKSIGLGYVRDANGVSRDYVLAGKYELEVAGERVPVQVFLDAPYDPKGTRVRG
ncbi:MAG: FAD-dependent oxidoreductase, partial [Hyphomicrobiaceae bacterium]